jgi:hypothetical protein
MDDRTKGAWIIHHTHKINRVVHGATQFQSINLAGKCGLLLSAISADGEQTMPFPKVHALASAAGITTLEVQGIIDELKCIFPL